MNHKNLWILNVMFALTLLVSKPTAAHFIWVAKSAGSGTVNIYFGEGPSPDQKKFLSGLEGMKVWSIDKNGVGQQIDFSLKSEGSDGWFETKSGLFAVDADCEYGIFSRGDKSMFLNYSAKYIDYVPNFEMKSSGKLPLDITFRTQGSKTMFKVLHKNKPAAKCELQVVDHDDNAHDFTTDASGKVEFAAVPKGRWMVRAKVADETPGKVNDVEYSEKRYYCTLIVGTDNSNAHEKTEAVMPAKSADSTSRLSASTPYPEIPVGITSFGGAVAGEHVYVFGGHCGEAHDYYNSGQNKKLMRLNLKSPTKWESVSESDGLQGLAMIEHDGNLFRVGGFEARNAQGEDHDLHSVDQFAKFDFESKKWQPLQPLPAPRSSLDAVVVGDTLYVVGGWTMKGKEGTEWCEDTLSINLADPNAKWLSIKTPFQRRALSVGFQGDKLYAVGGMRKKGGPTTEVKVFDIESGEWSDGPNLPGSGSMAGFGSSCFNVGGRLIVSTYDGDVLQLNDSMSDWEKLHQLETGRFFHRLLPMSNDKFILVGGANMDIGKIHDVQVLSFN